jgi:hypothetical protein
MDTFFDLFNKTDLENTNKILITENEKDKVFKIYKNLKDSIYLAQIAEEIKSIKRRFLINLHSTIAGQKCPIIRTLL